MPGMTNLYHFMQDVDGRDKPGHGAKVLKSGPFGLNSGDFHDQVGQTLGRIEPSDRAG
jgi:hypothetical protein